MTGSFHNVTLPPVTVAITSRPSFPQLKLKVTPQAAVPACLAPPSPRGKRLETSIKVVPAVGSKITVAWRVDPKGLPFGANDSATFLRILRIAVGEWITQNRENLGAESIRAPEISLADGADLIITPLSSLPSDTPIGGHAVPSREPVAYLKRLDIDIRWASPATRKRVKADEEASEVVSAPPSSLAKPPSSQDGVSHDSEVTVEAEAILQVGQAMQKLMWQQMIRRFPYVFDPEFIQYQRALCVPPALFDATQRFITVSARFGTDLLPQARDFLEDLQETQTKSCRERVTAIVNLPTAARALKRSRVHSQPESQPPSQESQEDAKIERICDYMEELRIQDATKSVEDKLRDSLSEAISTIGTTRWIRQRTGRRNWSAVKAFIQEPQPLGDGEPLPPDRAAIHTPPAECPASDRHPSPAHAHLVLLAEAALNSKESLKLEEIEEHDELDDLGELDKLDELSDSYCKGVNSWTCNPDDANSVEPEYDLDDELDDMSSTYDPEGVSGLEPEDYDDYYDDDLVDGLDVMPFSIADILLDPPVRAAASTTQHMESPTDSPRPPFSCRPGIYASIANGDLAITQAPSWNVPHHSVAPSLDDFEDEDELHFRDSQPSPNHVDDFTDEVDRGASFHHRLAIDNGAFDFDDEDKQCGFDESPPCFTSEATDCESNSVHAPCGPPYSSRPTSPDQDEDVFDDMDCFDDFSEDRDCPELCGPEDLVNDLDSDLDENSDALDGSTSCVSHLSDNRSPYHHAPSPSILAAVLDGLDDVHPPLPAEICQPNLHCTPDIYYIHDLDE